MTKPTTLPAQPEPPAELPPPPRKELAASLQTKAFEYNYHLEDLYGFDGQEYFVKQTRPLVINKPYALKLSQFPGAEAVKVEHSPTDKFTREVGIFESVFGGLTVRPFYLGENFLRFTVDGYASPVTDSFTVKPKFLTDLKLKVSEKLKAKKKDDVRDVNLFYGTIQKSISGLRNFLVEISSSEKFELHRLKINYLQTENFVLARTEESQFIRVRGILKTGELSSYSEIYEVAAKPKMEQFLPPLASRAEKIPPQKEEPPPIPPLLEKPSEEREPSSVTSTSASDLLRDASTFNANFYSSYLQIEGAGSVMVSSEQINSNQSSPQNLTIAVRNKRWWGNQGVEGSIKSKVVAANSAANKSNPLSAEARYLGRARLGLNPFSSWKSSYIGFIFGYEYYKNSSAEVFTPEYNLLKGGFSLDFPMFENWDTGGEVLLGLGTESSKKYEVMGFLHRYLRRDLTLGLGYRIHLFESNSTKNFPSGALYRSGYREGYGEGFTSLRWHY